MPDFFELIQHHPRVSEVIITSVKDTAEFDANEYCRLVQSVEDKLSDLYAEASRVENSQKLDHVKEVLSQIGEIDMEVEGLCTSDNQRDLSIRFHWGHNHEFNDDLKVIGRMGDRHLNLMAQFIVRHRLEFDHFLEKDVIDVGCWTGGTTLLLKFMGAARVLALEEVQKYARVTKELACTVYEYEDVVSDGTNIFNLETDHKYDVAYFPGVIYHLSDPVLALRRLFNALKDGGEIFVETAGLDSDQPICRFDGNRVFHKAQDEHESELNRGGWNWFVPSPPCLERWMIEAGFEDIDSFYSPASGRVFGYGRRRRFEPITKAGLSRPDIE